MYDLRTKSSASVIVECATPDAIAAAWDSHDNLLVAQLKNTFTHIEPRRKRTHKPTVIREGDEVRQAGTLLHRAPIPGVRPAAFLLLCTLISGAASVRAGKAVGLSMYCCDFHVTTLSAYGVLPCFCIMPCFDLLCMLLHVVHGHIRQSDAWLLL